MNYIISCCSSVDLPESTLKENGIEYVPMHYSLDGVDYKDDLFKSISAKQFYEKLRNSVSSSTAQVNVNEYYEYFEGFLKNGLDVLHICLSGGITGTMNSAVTARNMLKEKYPDRRILLCDSLCASCGYGLVCLKAAELKAEGKSIDEVFSFIEEYKSTVEEWFFTSDLTYFVKGGRLSAVSGWFGTMLKICPLLEVDSEGKLIPREKCRGKQKAIEACFNKMLEGAGEAKKYNGRCYIANSDCLDDAEKLAEMIEANFPKLKGKVEIVDVGVIIGTHTGPGTTGLFFEGGNDIK